MRILAFILSAIAFVAILDLAQYEFYFFHQMLPAVLQEHSSGPEGLIGVGVDFMAAVVATPVALLFAYLHFRHNRSSAIARFLLIWCWVLVLVIVGTVLKTSLGWASATQ